MNFDLFLQTLPIMVKGMIGIFFVIGLIMVCVMLLEKYTSNGASDSKE